jgi:hypothetical protein
MTPQGKKRLIIGTGLLIIFGVVGYIVYRNLKKPDDETGTPPTLPPPSTDQSNTGSNTNTGSTQYTFPFKTRAEGDLFRVWVNTYYPDYAKSIDLSKSGPLNSFLEKAWISKGAEYLKGSTTTQPTIKLTTEEKLNELEKNLAGSIFTILRYIDRVSLSYRDKNNNYYNVSLTILPNTATQVISFSIKGPTINKSSTGNWSNNGKTIQLKNGRVFKNDNVGQNIMAMLNS